MGKREYIPSINHRLRKNLLAGALVILLCLEPGCASLNSALGISSKYKAQPISNPFYAYHAGPNGDGSPPMVLRTRKGDRSVEIEIPGGSERLSDFVIPVSPAFRDSGEKPESGNISSLDESYKNRAPSSTDLEITRRFSQSTIVDEAQRSEIERDMNLVEIEDNTPAKDTPSYLASMDHIRQLYRASRYEAALLEVDEMVRLYQNDPRLHQMRGTLLERLGRHEMALKSWNQALRFDPKNESLRKFIDRKQLRSQVATP